MCGIIGLFLKDPALEPRLGELMADMLVQMSERGPDSAGFAIYDESDKVSRLTVRSDAEDPDFDGLGAALSVALGATVKLEPRATHAVLAVPKGRAGEAREALRTLSPDLDVMSWGEAIEIYKEVGAPQAVSERFGLDGMRGTHGVGHTRMATESAVTTMGAHPFSTGPDQCLVHNGSLSNHNALRRELTRDGMSFETENDSEVAAAYLTARMAEGADLGEALESGLQDLDGFFTFVVGTQDGFGVLRDPVACKPAILAETDRYVAFGSEYRALADLPGIEAAKVWEPEPGTVYFWSR